MLVRFLESKASRDIVAHAFAYTKEPQIKQPRNHQVTYNDPPVKHSGTTKEPTWSKASHVRSHIRSRYIERMSKHMTVASMTLFFPGVGVFDGRTGLTCNHLRRLRSTNPKMPKMS